MPQRLRSARPFQGLFQRLRQSDGDRRPLQEAAQLALQVEFATIPVYLTGMYSISDTGSTAYQALRAVVMEEMFHVNQAANLVVALGALPRFTGNAAPTYPGYLPQSNESTTPLLGLVRASRDVFESLYAAIESPAPAGAPPQGDQYDTIAQLYDALKDGILAYPGNPFEAPAPEGRQRTDIYLGKFGGHVIEVTDVKSALLGIEEIVKQGEGTVPARKPLVDMQPFGAYNHYGTRTDGTYGPILGTPYELSHFSRFRQVSVSKEPFPETLPITSNPNEEDYSNPSAQHLSQLFDNAYSVMLKAFELSFRAGPDPYFGVVLDTMHQVLPNLARSLMTTAAFDGGNSSVGPNATPAWRWRPDAVLDQTGQRLRQLSAQPPAGLPPAAQAHVAQASDAWQRLVVAKALPAL